MTLRMINHCGGAATSAPTSCPPTPISRPFLRHNLHLQSRLSTRRIVAIARNHALPGQYPAIGLGLVNNTLLLLTLRKQMVATIQMETASECRSRWLRARATKSSSRKNDVLRAFTSWRQSDVDLCWPDDLSRRRVKSEKQRSPRRMYTFTCQMYSYT